MTNSAGLRPAHPRIPALRADELDEVQRRLVEGISPQFTTVPNVVLTLVRQPELYEAFLPLAGRLLNGSSFSDRQRELVIMRTAVVVGSRYEWGQHVALSRDLFDERDLARIVAGPSAPGWDDLEGALVSAVDELHDGGGITDATWARLAAGLDQRQLVELPMLVGQYHMIAFVVHALGIQPEEGSADLPAAG